MRSRTLYIHSAAPTGTNILLQPDSSFALQTREAFVQGDRFALRLAFMQVVPPVVTGGDPTVVYETLEGGETIVVAAKSGAAVVFGDVLFASSDFEQVVEGEGEEQKIYYSGICNLNTRPIDKLFKETKAKQAEIEVDVEVQTPGNTARMTYRFTATLLSQAYSGEVEPVEGEPPYPPPSALQPALADATQVIDTEDDTLSYDLALDAEPAQVIVTVRRPEGGASHLATSWSIENAGATLRVHLSALPPDGTQIYVTLIGETA